MSSNRLIYDTCAYQKEMSKQCDQLTYILDPTKHYQEEPCRPELGILGGNSVSIVRGNLVDLETDLRGLTRYNTRCQLQKNNWIPKNDGKIVIPKDGVKNGLVIDTNKLHLPPCQMIRYEPVPLPPGQNLPCMPPRQKMQNPL
uniref:Uncharacterized protein n=1 Tax=viral metagenome TaxID=1070528 RepID=A0A6C0L0K7_9ZZZZ|tara:strand:+ start:20933 stop:21361 length:429 start_codon:yes stop_codon:yes gene_type:complete